MTLPGTPSRFDNFWQLWQHLRCHGGQLCIHFVHGISHFLHFKKKWNSFDLLFDYDIVASILSVLGRIVLISDLKCHINHFFVCENLYTKWMESCPLWHHRHWQCCQLKDPHRKDLLKLSESISLEWIVRFRSNFHSLLFLFSSSTGSSLMSG